MVHLLDLSKNLPKYVFHGADFKYEKMSRSISKNEGVRFVSKALPQ